MKLVALIHCSRSPDLVKRSIESDPIDPLLIHDPIDPQERQSVYRQLFNHHIPEASLSEIRTATNKARGGDRKSEKFKINRVGPY
jgi:hypothetical protein